MTPSELRDLAMGMDPFSQAPHAACFNRGRHALHERDGGPGCHRPTVVGRTTWIVASEGYPPYRDWVRAYFESGAVFDGLQQHGRVPSDQCQMHGRSPSYLLEQVQRLQRFALRQPEAAHCAFDERMVAEFLLHLIFVQSWVGAQGEKVVVEALNARCPTWRCADFHTDVQQGIDLVHDRSPIGVQVKKRGWTSRTPYVSTWLDKSSNWDGPRWVVEYEEPVERGGAFRVGQVFEVRMNPDHPWPFPSSFDDLVAAASGPHTGPKTRG